MRAVQPVEYHASRLRATCLHVGQAALDPLDRFPMIEINERTL